MQHLNIQIYIQIRQIRRHNINKKKWELTLIKQTQGKKFMSAQVPDVYIGLDILILIKTDEVLYQQNIGEKIHVSSSLRAGKDVNHFTLLSDGTQAIKYGPEVLGP